MSDSLFLDPFAVPPGPSGPSWADESHDGPRSGSPDSFPPASSAASADGHGEVVPGTVVGSGPAVAAAGHEIAAAVPLDLDQAVGAFVDDTHLWWPRGLRATGDDGHVHFGEGALLEEGADDSQHEWATLVGAAEGALELDWWGGRARHGTPGSDGGSPDPDDGAPVPDHGTAERSELVAGRSAAPRSAVRLYLEWAPGTEGGAEVTVKGNGPASWVEDWTVVLGAFARFTGGHLTTDPGGA